MIELENKTVLVTGASGLIGAAVVEALLKSGANVLAAGRNISRLKEKLGDCDGLSFLEYDATRHNEFAIVVDCMVLAASPASPDLYVSKPVDVMLANTVAVNELLDYAVRNGVDAIDTAAAYGSAEEVVGEFLGRRTVSRDRLFIVSKFGTDVFEGVAPGEWGAALSVALARSLKRLKTDYLDAYVCHVAMAVSNAAVCEAMAAGLPVVAYDLPAYQKIYRGAYKAIPCYDFDAFAKAIVQALDDPSDFARLQSLGTACAAQYDWNAIAAADSAAL